jgi:hypothetical protein
MLKFLQTDRQTDRLTDRQTGQKLYAPDLSIRGHKKQLNHNNLHKTWYISGLKISFLECALKQMKWKFPIYQQLVDGPGSAYPSAEVPGGQTGSFSGLLHSREVWKFLGLNRDPPPHLAIPSASAGERHFQFS